MIISFLLLPAAEADKQIMEINIIAGCFVDYSRFNRYNIFMVLEEDSGISGQQVTSRLSFDVSLFTIHLIPSFKMNDIQQWLLVFESLQVFQKKKRNTFILGDIAATGMLA